MLFSRRNEEKAWLERESAGEDLGTKSFSPAVRTKVWFHLVDCISSDRYRLFAIETAHAKMIRSIGVLSLTGVSGRSDDLFNYLQTCPDEGVPDIIEAILAGLD